MRLDDFFHLTYCTNIHPGDGWDEVFTNIREHAPKLKEQLSPYAPFALGLRLSSKESEQLLEGDRLEQFRVFLNDNKLYVNLINGFPFGSFHNCIVKEEVFAPDWREESRVAYTLRLIEIIERLLPAGTEGGISTLPLSYKGWIAADDCAAWQTITRNIVRVVEAMVRVRATKDKLVHLDIEPEPDGLIENSAELIAFYRDWLLPVGAPFLAESLNVSLDQARRCLLDHVQICFDTCHFAVEYENPETALERFAQFGIKIGRVQISSALKIKLPRDASCRARLARQLESFAESTYLHQVVERSESGELRRFPDLSDALPTMREPGAREWRVHFHVPLFVEEYGAFGSTQESIRAVFKLLRAGRFTGQMEIETYTWDVLPTNLKQDLRESIQREYRWVLDEFARA